ncbi:peroxidase family protein [Thalassoporum mexicanum]|uniref:peroxidase family protein n=1 Tax=Thalassoporum mexicanum TaxID=3457544 RepID=UPI0006888FC4|nr:peroxidase family protein [Pseudanabaena sp. PCC 7367]
MEDNLITRNPFAEDNFETRRFDGTGNNLTDIFRTVGAVGTRFRRIAPVEYENGINSPAGIAPPGGSRRPLPDGTIPGDRPSARLISNVLADQAGQSITNDRLMSDMIWGVGQFLNHDTDLALSDNEAIANGLIAQGIPQDFPIPIPADDPVFGPNGTNPMPGGVLRFERDVFAPETGTIINGVPGEAINTVTAWLDLSTVYGSEPLLARNLSQLSDGMLRTFATDSGALLPPDFDGVTSGGAFMGVGFMAGDSRVNENSSLVAQHTLWVRNHNRLAGLLAATHPDWDNAKLFERSRQINIAQWQNIVLYEWLPALIGNSFVPEYGGYDPNLDPQTTNTFAVAALRIGHTLVSPQILRLDQNFEPLPEGEIAFIENFGAPDIITGENVDQVLRGLASGIAQEVALNVIDDLRNGLPVSGPVGFDLLAANIQRGRDRGLADYNELRRNLSIVVPELGIRPVSSFAEITSDPDLQRSLEELYGSVDDIDMWVGLMAEDHLPGASVGLTEQAVLGFQYMAMRGGDRFWFENPIETGGSFTAAEIAEIRNLRLSDIIELNTNTTGLRQNVFFTIDTQFQSGNDTDEFFTGIEGNDFLRGLGGNDTLQGNQGDDVLSGNRGFDLLIGDAGNDSLFGGANHDFLVGGVGSDLLSGDRGNDTISAVNFDGSNIPEFDFLIGGAGSDLFILGDRGNSNIIVLANSATIGDFTAGEDLIQLVNGTGAYQIEAIADGGIGIFSNGALIAALPNLTLADVGAVTAALLLV